MLWINIGTNMRITKLLLISLIFSILNSCINVKNKEQVYPKNDFKNISQIKITQYNSNFKKVLTNQKQIEIFTIFFQDSTNYFQEDLIEFNGVKPLYFLNFISDKENLELTLYPTQNNRKIEIGFFSPAEFKEKSECIQEVLPFLREFENN